LRAEAPVLQGRWLTKQTFVHMSMGYHSCYYSLPRSGAHKIRVIHIIYIPKFGNSSIFFSYLTDFLVLLYFTGYRNVLFLPWGLLFYIT